VRRGVAVWGCHSARWRVAGSSKLH
jgi:hypothetical protein